MTEHELKLNQKYYDAVKNGFKTFEVRKNDRDFRIGDDLYLVKVREDGENILDGHGRKHTLHAAVTYILTHDDFPDGVPEGYVVMSIKVIG